MLGKVKGTTAASKTHDRRLCGSPCALINMVLLKLSQRLFRFSAAINVHRTVDTCALPSPRHPRTDPVVLRAQEGAAVSGELAEWLPTTPWSHCSCYKSSAVVHNAEVQAVQTEEVSVDELWGHCFKVKKAVPPAAEPEVGDHDCHVI